jgi:hypothetical protein
MNKIKNNEMINFYENKLVKEKNIIYHNPAFEVSQIKHPAMIAVVGSTGAGKSQWLLNFIHKMPDTFSKIFIVHKVDEPLYKVLEEKLKDQIVFYKKLAELPNPDLLVKDDPKGQILLVFDDQVTEKNMNKIEEFYIRGRKSGGGITSVFLTQSYFGIPKIVRLQLHYLILLKLSGKRDLQLILSEYNLGVEKEQLEDIYKDATKQKFNFLKIDVATSEDHKKFSLNWNAFYDISN